MHWWTASRTVVVWCRNSIRYNVIKKHRIVDSVVVWCRNSIRYNDVRVARVIARVVVWCRNSIRYNSVLAGSPALSVVVWCRNSIRYNRASCSMPIRMVVVWCRNSIRYNYRGYPCLPPYTGPYQLHGSLPMHPLPAPCDHRLTSSPTCTTTTRCTETGSGRWRLHRFDVTRPARRSDLHVYCLLRIPGRVLNIPQWREVVKQTMRFWTSGCLAPHSVTRPRPAGKCLFSTRGGTVHYP